MAGMCAVNLRTSSGIAQIQIHGLTTLNCPRQMPWGPSECVNEVRLKDLASGIMVEIEMQSGDIVQISGASFAVS